MAPQVTCQPFLLFCTLDYLRPVWLLDTFDQAFSKSPCPSVLPFLLTILSLCCKCIFVQYSTTASSHSSDSL